MNIKLKLYHVDCPESQNKDVHPVMNYDNDERFICSKCQATVSVDVSTDEN